MVKLDVIDTLVVRIERKVGGGGSERPDLDGAVEASGRERVGVLGVEGEVHDVVRVSLKDLSSCRRRQYRQEAQHKERART